MPFRSLSSFLIGGLAATMMPFSVEGKTCLMIYQMADNNLEYYLRQDYQELTESTVVNSPDLRTWLYYDALNQGGQFLPNTIDSNGNPITTSYTGSRYVTYDQASQKMRIDKQLNGEQNSDTPSQIQAFLEHALTDCLANGYTSLFAVFSSHGGGFAGYGGDENARKLLQTNANIASAVKSALANTGGPAKLEVIGFDACLMQSVGAVDDYADVADYMLASEAVEPGHGWAYTFLTNANSALELAQEILQTFLGQTQGNAHQTPKTMAIVDTAKFLTFINAFENFAADLTAELKAGDVSLHSFVSRSRSAAIAFEGIVDAVGSQNPSALDIGSWLSSFKQLCNPGEPLQSDLDTAISTYYDMFIAEGTGPGTAAGTGMHVTWPNQGEFSANRALWNQVLFNNANYVTQITPNFKDFLQWFLSSSAPSSGGSSSTVCGEGSEAPPEAVQAAEPDALILTDSGVANPGTGTFSLRATISSDVSQMLVEYGLDLSTPLKPVLEQKGYEPRDEDYLYLLGGDVAGTYQGSSYSADWNQQFYFLNISATNTFEALYVFDQGDGSRKIPCMYFPEERRAEVDDMKFMDYLDFDFDGWLERGARFGFLMFSEDEAIGRINDNLALFVSSPAGVFAELPRSAGGLLIPLVYIDAFIQGRKLNTLPGGFNQTSIDWSTTLDYNILTTPASRVFDVIPELDAVVINMYAFDHGDSSKEPDARYYDVERKRGQLGGFTPEPDGSGTPGPLQSGASCLSAGMTIMAGLSVIVSFGLM